MTTKELKSEIQRNLDAVPDAILHDVLDYLKQFQDKSADKVQLASKIRRILAEDKRLLERLAK